MQVPERVHARACSFSGLQAACYPEAMKRKSLTHRTSADVSNRRSDTKIRSDEEVAFLVEALQKALGPELAMLPGGSRVSIEDTVRYASVAAQFRQRRQRLGLSLPESSRTLGIPQYRLKAIEQGTQSEIRREFLRSYATFLGLATWLRRWAARNRDLATRLRILSNPPRLPYGRR